jgi:hypothetical protein
MILTTRRALAAFLAVACGAAGADEAASTDRTFPEGWYVAPMATYFSPDSGRCAVDGGFGATAALGHRGEAASLEVWAQYLSVSHGVCNYTVPDSGNPPDNPDGDLDDDPDPVSEPAGDLKLSGGGLALLVGPFFKQEFLARLYGIVSVGVLKRSGHPQYASDDTTIVGDVGAGYLQPLRLWQRDFLVRVEARYRFDVQPPPHPDEQDPAPPHSYNDVVVSLGLQVPLSARPEPAAATEPVNVVPVTDTDRDGVPEEFDACPDTTFGAPVDAAGCMPGATPPQESPTGDAS